jgi:hypothetical protein
MFDTKEIAAVPERSVSETWFFMNDRSVNYVEPAKLARLN